MGLCNEEIRRLNLILDDSLMNSRRFDSRSKISDYRFKEYSIFLPLKNKILNIYFKKMRFAGVAICMSDKEDITEAKSFTYAYLPSKELQGILNCCCGSINQIVTGELISLSEQEFVDCDTIYDIECNGRLMDYTFIFLMKNGGIYIEKDYSHKIADGQYDVSHKNGQAVTIPRNNAKAWCQNYPIPSLWCIHWDLLWCGYGGV